MRHRTTSLTLAIAAVAALLIAAVGTAGAAKPLHPGSNGKGHHKAGLKVGVSKPTAGSTTLTLDPATATALTGPGGIIVGVVAPATGTYTFPVTGGRIVYHKPKKAGSRSHSKKQLSGFITHSGAITLTKGTTVVTLSDLRISLSAGRTGRLDATLSGASFKLGKLSAVVAGATDKTITAKVTLTRAAITALNGAYGLTLASPVVLGTIVVTPQF